MGSWRWSIRDTRSARRTGRVVWLSASKWRANQLNAYEFLRRCRKNSYVRLEPKNLGGVSPAKSRSEMRPGLMRLLAFLNYAPRTTVHARSPVILRSRTRIRVMQDLYSVCIHPQCVLRRAVSGDAVRPNLATRPATRVFRSSETKRAASPRDGRRRLHDLSAPSRSLDRASNSTAWPS